MAAKTEILTVRQDQKTMELLKELAAYKNVSQGELVSMAIELMHDLKDVKEGLENGEMNEQAVKMIMKLILKKA